MTAPTLFISDLHLSPQRPACNQHFFDFLQQEALDAAALYILGDLFDFWIGDDAADAIGQIPVIQQLHQYSKQQGDLYLVRGNRDFLLGQTFAEQSGCRLLPDETIISLAGEEVLLMHGDSLCSDDVPHQAFRKMVLDPDWQQRFLALPLHQRLQMATDARSQSELHKSLTSMAIMDVNPETVLRTIERYEVSRLIHGHTHRQAIHSLQLDDRAGERIVLGDWYTQSSVLIAQNGNFLLRNSAITQPSSAGA